MTSGKTVVLEKSGATTTYPHPKVLKSFIN
jgi:hypothetical protein